MYVLRVLDPEVDLEHFRTAYNWRTARRANRAGPTLSFEEFARSSPDEISFGLFNGELLAVYLIQQRGARSFQVHFASKRHVSKDLTVSGAIQLKNLLFEQGVTEVFGLLLPEHAKPEHPLRRFAERVGLTYRGETVHCGKVGERQVVMMKFAARR